MNKMGFLRFHPRSFGLWLRRATHQGTVPLFKQNGVRQTLAQEASTLHSCVPHMPTRFDARRGAQGERWLG